MLVVLTMTVDEELFDQVGMMKEVHRPVGELEADNVAVLLPAALGSP